jgi:L-ascorbate metabolism protein UlaG (beta-lactamase superfamily)
MVITYFGHEFFKVQFGDITLAFNPISRDSKLKTAKFGADIALISMHDSDMNGKEQVSYGEREAFVVEGPGEYEVGGVYVKGFPSTIVGSEKNIWGKLNTIYTVSLEGMNICFLGALQSKDLTAEIKAGLGDIDVLFVPIGGGEVLGAAEGYKLAVSLGAKLVIPMHYMAGKDGEAALKAFLKEGGKGEVKTEDKLTIKKKDLEGKEGEIVVLNPSL